MILVWVQYTLYTRNILGLRGVTGRYAPYDVTATDCTRGVPEGHAGQLLGRSSLGSMKIGPHETHMGLIYNVYLKDHRFTGRYGALRPIRCGHACTRGVPERYAGPLPSAWPLGSM